MDMRITSAYGVYSVQQTRGAFPAGRGAERPNKASDSVSISSQASDYQAAKRAVASTPDIRADLVNRIQNQIASGTYSVSAGDVAASIFHGLG